MIRSSAFITNPANPAYPYEQMDLRNRLLSDLFDKFLIAFEPKIVCDIGAMDGKESRRFLDLQPSAQIFAFEANPTNYEKYFKGNDTISCERFNIDNVAISDQCGLVEFNVLDTKECDEEWRHGASSLLVRTDNLSCRTITVNSVTLDEYFSEMDIKEQSFALWIDVEGALDKVVAGAQNILPQTIFIKAELEIEECWKNQKLADEMLEILNSLGFCCIANSFIPRAYKQYDAIFLNKNMMSIFSNI